MNLLSTNRRDNPGHESKKKSKKEKKRKPREKKTKKKKKKSKFERKIPKDFSKNSDDGKHQNSSIQISPVIFSRVSFQD